MKWFREKTERFQIVLRSERDRRQVALVWEEERGHWCWTAWRIVPSKEDRSVDRGSALTKRDAKRAAAQWAIGAATTTVTLGDAAAQNLDDFRAVFGLSRAEAIEELLRRVGER
ncbi:hypothetical protein WMF38_57160 [Sorangium sp. So ce118]